MRIVNIKSSVSPAVKFFETSQEIDKDDDPISSDVLKVENFQYTLKIHKCKTQIQTVLNGFNSESRQAAIMHKILQSSKHNSLFSSASRFSKLIQFAIMSTVSFL